MKLRQRLYRGLTRFDFVGNRKRWFILSGVLLLISLLALGFRGLNLGIDFVGGTSVEAPNPAAASVEDVRSALGAVGQEGAKVQLLGGGDAISLLMGDVDGNGRINYFDFQIINDEAAAAGNPLQLVPEPGSAVLLLCGALLGPLCLRRRSR